MKVSGEQEQAAPVATVPTDPALASDGALLATAQAGYRVTTWTALVVTIIQTAQLLLVPRIVGSPSEFGLFAMMQLTAGFAAAFADLGISAAVVQRKDHTPEKLSRLYLVNIIASVVAASVVATSGSLLSAFYDEPRLAALAPWAAAPLLVTAVGQQFGLLMQKELEFHRLSWIDLRATVAAFLTVVIAAAAGFGVLALLWGPLALATVRSGLLLWAGWSRWPVRWVRGPVDIRPYLSFGAYQVGERMVNFLVARMDQLAIGHYGDAGALGLYNLAQQYTTAPLSRVNPAFNVVALPVISRQSDHPEQMRRTYLDLLQKIIHVNAPLMAGLAAVAAPVVAVAAGPEWVDAAPVMALLALVQLVRSHANPVGLLLAARGRSDQGFWWNIGVLATEVPVLFLAASTRRLDVVVLVLLLLQLTYTPLNYLFLVRPHIGGSASAYTAAVVRPMLPALGMGLMVAAVSACLPMGGPMALRLMALVAVGGGIHTAILWFWMPEVLDRARCWVFGQTPRGG